VTLLRNPPVKSYAVCAGSILEAWQQKNLPRLQDELDCASSLEVPSAMTAAERERVELLESIAAQLKSMVAQGTVDQANPYSMLLRHLASDC